MSLRSAALGLRSSFFSAASTCSRNTLWSVEEVRRRGPRGVGWRWRRVPRRAARCRHRGVSFCFLGEALLRAAVAASSSSSPASSLPHASTSFSSSSRTACGFLEQVVAELLVERGADVFVARGEAQGLDARAGELAVEAERALDLHLPVTEGGVGEDLRLRRFLEGEEGVADALDVLGGEFAVLLAHVLAQRAEPLGGVDELHLAAAVLGLAVGEHPDIGGDAGVVEHVQRQGDDGLQPVVLDDPAADVALALAGVAGEERRAVVHLGDAAAERRVVLHLAQHVGQEEHLAVAASG